MNERFKNMTDSIVTRYVKLLLIIRIDDMSERIDDLEKTVCKLVEESNMNENNINDNKKGINKMESD